MNFAKFVKTLFLLNSTGRMLLIMAVSMVVEGVLANEIGKCELLKKDRPGERTGLRSSGSQASN